MRYTKANKNRLTPPYQVFLFLFRPPEARMCYSPWTRVFQQKVGRVGVWLSASPSAQPIVKNKVTRSKNLLYFFYVHVQLPGWTGGGLWPHPVNRLPFFIIYKKVGRDGKLLVIPTRSTALLSCYPFWYLNTKKDSRLIKRRGSVNMVYQPISPHFFSGLDKHRPGGEWYLHPADFFLLAWLGMLKILLALFILQGWQGRENVHHTYPDNRF